MLKNITVLWFLISCGMANASTMAPKLCSSEELNNLRAIWADMEKNGFEQAIASARIGMTAGDCVTPYSLESIAGRPHKQDAPRPSCAVMLTLSYDEPLAAEQAKWILDTVGTVYKTEAGVTIRLCARVSAPGPHPGVTVHN